jgi:HlyD family secretion protein
MKNFFAKIGTAFKKGAARTGSFVKKHKIVSGIIVLVILGGGYWAYAAMAAGNSATEYVLGRAAEGPLQVTVTDSGQVSSEDDLDLTPQASGQITEIYVQPGQQVKAGTIVAELDMTTAAQAVTSAKQDLEAAQISYQQTLASSNGGVTNDQTTVQTDQTATANAVIKAYTDLPAILQGINSTLHNISTVSGFTALQNVDAYESYVPTATAKEYQQQVKQDDVTTNADYQRTQAEYAAVDPNSLSTAQIETLAQNTEATTKAVDTEVKDIATYLDYINSQITLGDLVLPSQLTSQISSINGYETTISGDDTSLTSSINSLISAQTSLSQDTESLSSTSNVPLTVQNAQLNVQKAQESVDEAETNESDYIVRAPFDGTIATVPVNVYDQASSGTTVATLITNEEYVDLSVNEADAATLAVGQEASFTFDAITGLTLNGTVAQIAPVGTVTQGVVTYDVKVGFTTQDSRVKPGMTAEATIITNNVSDAIQVPTSAVTTVGTMSYVEVATLKNASSTTATAGAGRSGRTASSTGGYTRGSYGTEATGGDGGYGGYGSGTSASTTSSTTSVLATPLTTRSLTETADNVTITRVPVVTGISNDTMIQITSGLKPGQLVVTSTTKAATKSTTSSSSGGLFGLLGGGTRKTTGAAGATGGAAGGYGGGAGLTGGYGGGAGVGATGATGGAGGGAARTGG